MRRQSAYYSRAGSFSRSFNAEVAESEGRLPRTRAAATLGVSVPAFDAGCKSAGYVCAEWHHVGKYASRVDYYDTELLRVSPAFWEGAAAHYKSAVKRAAMLAAAAQARIDAAEAERSERRALIDQFRAKLVRQRDCTRAVRRHDARHAWRMRCQRVGTTVPEFDVSSMLAAVEAWKVREAAAIAAARRFNAILSEHFRKADDREYVGLGLRLLVHGGNSQASDVRRAVNIYGMKNSINLKIADAVALLEHWIVEALGR